MLEADRSGFLLLSEGRTVPDLFFDKSALRLISLNHMENEWTELLVTGDELEGEMIKDLLESGGISVVIRSAKVRPYPVSIGKMGEITLLVRKTDLEAARAALKQE